ncbi:hypothetical protein AGR5A_pa40020 [Agrobacterium genomosp. 5 str. CFBP 6626]|nr:hypothetical protein AGR5A_pa40020 [Agrobacterium genomosp. 5 str. CFBP 6626]
MKLDYYELDGMYPSVSLKPLERPQKTRP